MGKDSSDVYLFRKLEHNKLVSVHQHQHLIDIHECWESTEQGSVKRGIPPQVQFVWDDIKISPVSKITRLQCNLENVDDQSLFFSSEMLRDDFHQCRHFLKMIYGLVGSRVVRLDPRNVSFDILHDDEPSCSKIREKQSESLVLTFFKKFVKATGKDVKFEIKMNDISEDEQNKLREELISKKKRSETYNKSDMEYLKEVMEEQKKISILINELTSRGQAQGVPKQYKSSSEQPPPFSVPDISTYQFEKREQDESREEPAEDQDVEFLKPKESTDQGKMDEGAAGGDTLFPDEKIALLQSFQNKDDPISKRYRQTIERNYRKGNPQKSAGSLCTVLCLDSSASMEGKPLADLKRIALQIVDGIEENAEENELEENIAVVTISGEAAIAQPLTNDYAKVRDAIGSLEAKGRTPLHESFIVCLCALEGGSVPNMNGIYQIRPRIIFITDGKPTDETRSTGPDTEDPGSNSRIAITKTISDMGRSTTVTMPKPLTWIAVGDSNKQFLSNLAKLCKEKLSSEEDIPRISRHYVIQDGIGKVLCFVIRDRSKYEHDVDAIEAIANGLVSNLKPGESRQIVDGVLEKMKHHTEEPDPVSFDNVFENRTLPALGSRVIRGPDWKWGDQDHNGIGTIINHDKTDKWLWVEWDGGGRNRYNYTPENGYDVLLVDAPRDPSLGGIEIGVRVERGPDWHHDDEDGGPGYTGVVIRKYGMNQVKVRWGNGRIKDYNFGGNGKYEISCCGDTTSRGDRQTHRDNAERNFKPDDPHARPHPPTESRSPGEEKKGEGTLVWQWQDDLQQWRLYSDQDQEKINKTYSKKPDGSCLVQRGGVSYRLILRDMSEKEINGDGRRHVQKVWMSDEELANMKSIENFL